MHSAIPAAGGELRLPLRRRSRLRDLAIPGPAVGAMTLELRQLGSPLAALGAAMHFLGRRPPFADFPASVLVDTLHGQIARGHYLVALEAQRLRAYVGWATLDTAVAERLAQGGAAPSQAEAASGGDVVWVLTVAATDRAALMACVNRLRGLYPGQRVMGVRHGRHGKVVRFDSRLRPRRGLEAGPRPDRP